MLSDEEKKAFANLKTEYEKLIKEDNILFPLYKSDAKRLINLIEKQSKEIEELSDKLTEKICKGVEEEILEEYRQTIISKDKEIEELKEDKYGLEEEVQIQAKNLMLYENALYEIQNKIKAKIEPRLKELDEQMKKEWKEYGNSREYQDMEDEWNFLQSLLEKE